MSYDSWGASWSTSWPRLPVASRNATKTQDADVCVMGLPGNLGELLYTCLHPSTRSWWSLRSHGRLSLTAFMMKVVVVQHFCEWQFIKLMTALIHVSIVLVLLEVFKVWWHMDDFASTFSFLIFLELFKLWCHMDDFASTFSFLIFLELFKLWWHMDDFASTFSFITSVSSFFFSGD
jgi:hypothetical protein